jgi:hypothetical protein
MKQLPKALERNGDLWVAAPTKHLLFRVLQDVRAALESPSPGSQPDHSEELASLSTVEALLGLDQFDRALPPVNEQLGEPTARQACVLRNLYRLRTI